MDLRQILEISIDVLEAIARGEASGDVAEKREQGAIIHELLDFLHAVGEILPA